MPVINVGREPFRGKTFLWTNHRLCCGVLFSQYKLNDQLNVCEV